MLTLEHHVTTRLLVGRQSVPLPGPEPVAPRLARPETIIVHEPWWTATARHADIVLQATTSLERNDIGGEPCDRFVIAMHQSIEPVGEARNDFEIFRDLSRRLGCEEAFAEGRDETAWLAKFTAPSASGRRAISYRSSRRFGKRADSKFRHAQTDTCCSTSSAPTPITTSCARPRSGLND